MNRELYCKVYLDGDGNAASIKQMIADVLRGNLTRRTIRSETLLIDVFDNRKAGASESPDDFVRWPYYLEVEPIDPHIKFDSYVSALAFFLNGLRKKGLSVVPSCDFEDELAELMS
jgi:hypothetical protein